MADILDLCLLLLVSSIHTKVRLLEPGHLEEDYPITRVSEHQRFSISFANRPITFIILTTVS